MTEEVYNKARNLKKQEECLNEVASLLKSNSCFNTLTSERKDRIIGEIELLLDDVRVEFLHLE